MASGAASEQLTRKQIVRLAAAISADHMESVAEGYMDIDSDTIKNIRRDASNSEAFNRDVIRHWMYKNPSHQSMVLLSNHTYFFNVIQLYFPSN